MRTPMIRALEPTARQPPSSAPLVPTPRLATSEGHYGSKDGELGNSVLYSS